MFIRAPDETSARRHHTRFFEEIAQHQHTHQGSAHRGDEHGDRTGHDREQHLDPPRYFLLAVRHDYAALSSWLSGAA